MTAPTPIDVRTVFHLYRQEGDEIVACGMELGPESLAPGAEWHTGRLADDLLRAAYDQQWCCNLCLALAERRMYE